MNDAVHSLFAMKKGAIILLVNFLFLVVFSDKLKAQVGLGLRSGVNFSKISFDSDEFSGIAKHKIGFNTALLVSIPLNSLVSVRFEPGYSKLGTKYLDKYEFQSDQETTKHTASADLSLGYLEIPVLFQLNPKAGKIETNIQLGPEFRYKLSFNGSSKYEYFENGVLDPDESFDETEVGVKVLKKMDFGAVGGIGVTVHMRSFRIFAEARYHFGLSNLVSKKDYKATYDEDFDGTLQDRSKSINIGILFPIGK